MSELLTGAVSDKPTVVLGYPVRNASGAITGVLALGLNLERLETLFRGVPLPDGSVVTLTDAQSRVLARSRDAERLHRQADRTERHAAARRAAHAGPHRAWTASSAPTATRSSSADPWLLSVGIPTSLALTRVAPLYRRNLIIAVTAIGAVLLLALGLSTLMSRGVNGVRDAVRRIAERRSVAARQDAGAEPRARRAAGRVHHDGGEPARNARRARPSGRAGTQDARDAAVAAAPGRPSGTSGGGRACSCPASRTS